MTREELISGLESNGDVASKALVQLLVDNQKLLSLFHKYFGSEVQIDWLEDHVSSKACPRLDVGETDGKRKD